MDAHLLDGWSCLTNTDKFGYKDRITERKVYSGEMFEKSLFWRDVCLKIQKNE